MSSDIDIHEIAAEVKRLGGMTAWRKYPGNDRLYKQAQKAGLLPEIRSLVGIKYKKWTFDEVVAIARRFNSPSEWEIGHRDSYQSAQANGWLNKCQAQAGMTVKIREWTAQACKADATQYESPQVWRQHSPGAYAKARKEGWYHECIQHMTGGYTRWTLESIIEDAKRYAKTSDWRETKSYRAAERRGIIEDVIIATGMERSYNRITKESVKASIQSLGFERWKKQQKFAYEKAKNQGWLD